MTVLTCRASNTLAHSARPWYWSVCASRAVDGSHTLLWTVVPSRTLCARKTVVASSGAPVGPNRAVDRNCGGKGAVLSSRAREAVRDLAGSRSGPVGSRETARGDHCALRAELARGTDVARRQLGPPWLVTEVTCWARGREGAGNGTVGSRVTRLAVGVLSAMRTVEVGASWTISGSD